MSWTGKPRSAFSVPRADLEQLDLDEAAGDIIAVADITLDAGLPEQLLSKVRLLINVSVPFSICRTQSNSGTTT